MNAERKPPPSRGGFSLLELLVILAALGLAVWLVLRVVDRGTRIGPALPATGPEAVLESALSALRKEVLAAGTGGPTGAEAVRLVGDNADGRRLPSYRTVGGAPVAVRPGTDQLGLRGVIRTPLLKLEPAAGAPFADRVRRDPAAVAVRAAAAPGLAPARARLRESAAPAKAFFLVRDGSGRWAVGRVASANDAEAGPLDLVLDFTDADARALGPAGDAAAASRLGEPEAGGAFDDLVWFVALGPEGRPPDYVSSSDPDSLAFPHPYLAVAAAAGGGRWDVRRVGEDVENFQVAWGFEEPAGALVWRADAPGAAAPSPEEFTAGPGRPALRKLKVALVARAPQRLPRSSGSPPPEFVVPLNGPEPETAPGAAPIGWDPAPQRRIRFDREAREVVLAPPALARDAR